MTLAEMEVSLKRLTDNQIVQGELLGRLERVVDPNTEATAANTKAMTRLADNMQVMQTAMRSSFEHMDRFIQGLEGNGDRPR